MATLADMIAEHELTTEAESAALPGPLKIEFLLDLPGVLPGSIRFRKGETYTDPNAWFFLRKGLARPICEEAKAYCEKIGLTDAKIFTLYKKYLELLKGNFKLPDQL